MCDLHIRTIIQNSTTILAQTLFDSEVWFTMSVLHDTLWVVLWAMLPVAVSYMQPRASRQAEIKNVFFSYSNLLGSLTLYKTFTPR